MTRPQRLLIVVNDAAFFLSHRLPLAQAAREAGFDVHIATPQDRAAERIRAEGFAFHAIPMNRRSVGPFGELAAIAGLISLYRRLRPTLVHHVTSKPVIYGGIAARIASVPAVVAAVTGLGYVFIARGWRVAMLRALIATAYRSALRHPRTCVIFQNPDNRAEFLAARLIRAEQAVIIPGSGVDTTLFAATPEPAGRLLVVLPARLLWHKGVAEFVEAARLLRARGSSARFALVGGIDPDNPAAVPAAQVESWQRDGTIEWWGQRDDMPQVFAQAHVVCLPSYGEGLPKALIEAASCARPIVATDVPGCREIVRHDENGLRVPVRDAGTLAEALATLLGDAALRVRLGARGRAMVEAEFAVERIVDATLALYRRQFQAVGAIP